MKKKALRYLLYIACCLGQTFPVSVKAGSSYLCGSHYTHSTRELSLTQKMLTQFNSVENVSLSLFVADFLSKSFEQIYSPFYEQAERSRKVVDQESLIAAMKNFDKSQGSTQQILSSKLIEAKSLAKLNLNEDLYFVSQMDGFVLEMKEMKGYFESKQGYKFSESKKVILEIENMIKKVGIILTVAKNSVHLNRNILITTVSMQTALTAAAVKQGYLSLKPTLDNMKALIEGAADSGGPVDMTFTGASDGVIGNDSKK
ncbi:MAG: hypothetical protein HUU56_00930 [Bdellovibrionaceae bacterium]|nr:hypothetical protein [Pseudobdellovibrionaceae bacterium]